MELPNRELRVKNAQPGLQPTWNLYKLNVRRSELKPWRMFLAIVKTSPKFLEVIYPQPIEPRANWRQPGKQTVRRYPRLSFVLLCYILLSMFSSRGAPSDLNSPRSVQN